MSIIFKGIKKSSLLIGERLEKFGKNNGILGLNTLIGQ
jgi:hypothetical protein